MTPEEMTARIDQAIQESAEVLVDGLQPGDISILVRNGVELADNYAELSGERKREFAVTYASALIDEHLTADNPHLQRCVRELDLPGPDWIEAAVWDPLLIRIAPDLLRPIIKEALPRLFDLVVDATRGRVAVNRGKEASDV